MTHILKQAKTLYPTGTLFYSCSELLKSPLKVVKLKIAENYKDTIVNIEGGIVYSDGVWAKKV
jgi:hypothetical protein